MTKNVILKTLGIATLAIGFNLHAQGTFNETFSGDNTTLESNKSVNAERVEVSILYSDLLKTSTASRSVGGKNADGWFTIKYKYSKDDTKPMYSITCQDLITKIACLVKNADDEKFLDSL